MLLWLLGNLVKKLCQDFACSKSSKRRLREIAAPDLRAALAVRHLSGCERPCFVPRKTIFRSKVRHVSRCERCLTARRNVEFERRKVEI